MIWIITEVTKSHLTASYQIWTTATNYEKPIFPSPPPQSPVQMVFKGHFQRATAGQCSSSHAKCKLRAKRSYTATSWSHGCPPEVIGLWPRTRLFPMHEKRTELGYKATSWLYCSCCVYMLAGFAMSVLKCFFFCLYCVGLDDSHQRTKMSPMQRWTMGQLMGLNPWQTTLRRVAVCKQVSP